MYPQIPEYIEGLPNISGSEDLVDQAVKQGSKLTIFKNESHIDFGSIKSAFAVALHMHQPLIPAGGGDLRTAAIISNLKYMMDNQGIGDNHNAPVFLWCYKRMGEFIPQLVDEGKNPRVMLDYSGTLLHGLRAMGANDVFDNLKRITCDPTLSSLRRMARQCLGARGRALDSGAGLSPAHQGLAATLCGDFRIRSARTRARFLPRRNGASQPSGPCL